MTTPHTTAQATIIIEHIKANYAPPAGWRFLMGRLELSGKFSLALYDNTCGDNPEPSDAVMILDLDSLDIETANTTAQALIRHAKTCDSLAKMLTECIYLVFDPARKGKVESRHSPNEVQVVWQPEKQLFDRIPYLAEWGDRPTSPFNAGVSLSLDRITQGMAGTLILDAALDHLVQLPTLSSRPIRREGQTETNFAASVCAAATQIALDVRARLSAIHAQTKALWHIINQSTTLIEVLEYTRANPQNEPPPSETPP